MTFFRLSGVCLVVLLISACDKEPPQPPKAPVPAPPSVSAPVQPSPAVEPVKPEPAPVSKPAAKPEPVPKPIAQKLIDPNALQQHAQSLDKAGSKAPSGKAKEATVKPVVRAPQPPEKIQRLHVNKPQTAQQRQASEGVKKQKLEKPKLDLRLPKDLVNTLEPEVADSNTPAPTLLPQMFADKPAQQSSFEMGGRIITNEHSRDTDKDASYWDTVDGAELQFKFNH